MASLGLLILVLPLIQGQAFEGFQMAVLTKEPSLSERLDSLDEKRDTIEKDVDSLLSDVTGLKSHLASCTEAAKQNGVFKEEKMAADTMVEQLTSEIESVKTDLAACKVNADQLDVVKAEKTAAEKMAEKLTTDKNELETTLVTCIEELKQYETGGQGQNTQDSTDAPKEAEVTATCPEEAGYTLDKGVNLCYKVVNDEMVENSRANTSCVNSYKNARLVVLNTQEKWDLIRNFANTQPMEHSYWVGAFRTDEDPFDVWSDGSLIDTTFWNVGEPNNWHGSEACMSMDGRRGYLANDDSCSNVFNFICEVPM